MKKTLLCMAIAALTLTIGTNNTYASLRNSRAKVERNETADSISIKEAAQILNKEQLEAYKARLDYELRKEEAKHRHNLEEQAQMHKEDMESEESYRALHRFDSISDLISNIGKWLLICMVPIFAMLVYSRKSKEEQREREALIDLVRTGTPITPEVVKLLGRDVRTTGMIAPFGKNSKKISKIDYMYTIKHIAWAGVSLLIGFILSCSVNNGVFFACGAVLAIIFTVQAIVRYAVAKKSDDNNQENNSNAQ